MTKTSSSKDSLYSALTPLLDNGADETAVSKARKQHRKTYKAAWQREYRKQHKLFTIAYRGNELSIIKAAAKGHRRSITKFIAEAALAYCARQYVVVDNETVQEIRELLKKTYTAVQQLGEEVNASNETMRSLQAIVADLQTNVMTSLGKPRLVQHWINDEMAGNKANHGLNALKIP